MRVLLATLMVVSACAPRDAENSAACAITMMASANNVLDQLRSRAKVIDEAPPELDGVVPARVVGYGTGQALAASGDGGTILGYEGEGFPTRPGFGLALLEDSAEVFQGVLIYDLDPPRGLTQLGTISSASATIPLFGTRITWAAVSTERCPLFSPPDSTAGSE